MAKGPYTEIGLPSDKAILLVQVPSGHNAPYIHSSGRIYRRIADSSDPKPETDRATLDLLYERGRRDRERLATFLTEVPLLSRGESDYLSFVQVYLMADPLGDKGVYSSISFSRFAEIMSETTEEAGGIPFENAMPTGNGSVARQVNENNPYNLTLTWKLHDDLSSVIIIPFNSTPIDEAKEALTRFLDGYKYSASLIDACNRVRLQAGSVLDTNLLYWLLIGLISKYRYLAKESGYKGTIYAKTSVHNVWRRVPFLDLQGYAEFVTHHGVPIIQAEGALAPPGTDPTTLVEIEWKDFSPGSDDNAWRAASAFKIWSPILLTLGIPYKEIFGVDTNKLTERFNEVWDLVERSQRAQKLRNQT